MAALQKLAPDAFEDRVRDIARAMWPSAKFQGATILNYRERDGLFVTEDSVHILEATTSREKAKARKDGEKLRDAALQAHRTYPYKSVKGWFVTQDEPQADQRDVIKRLNAPVVALSVAQFQSLLVDGPGYLRARDAYPFGSARSPSDDGLDPGEYVPLDTLQLHASTLWTVDLMVSRLLTGDAVLLLGDYGAGKSMTLRECYYALSRAYSDGHSQKFPLHLNLREHWGQVRPAEAITRHAEEVGFEHPAQLVRAWRSGYAVVLLDGFDELASVNWLGRSDKLKEARRRAVELVRVFVDQTPRGAGLFIAGRQHYFDSEQERLEALGLPPVAPQLTLNDFTEAQVQQYLSARGWATSIPSWLPSRPLLLGYLASRDLLKETLRENGAASPPAGWDSLLTRVCAREAEIRSALDGGTIRRIVERIATSARETESGLGPISPEAIYGAFRDITGQAPDEGSLVLLQRLPGLGGASAVEHEAGTSNKWFIDDSFADAARVGDVLSFVRSPFGNDAPFDAGQWQALLQSLGVALLAERIHSDGGSPALVRVALDRAIQLRWYALASDLVRAAMILRSDVDLGGIYISETWIPELELSDARQNLSGVEFQHCIIQTLRIEPGASIGSIPKFIDCNVGFVEGAASSQDLPAGRFVDCEFEGFAERTTTTTAILELPLPLATRVALTVLKKIYVQRGTGRKENALYRGLDDSARRYVPEVIDELVRYDLISQSRAGGETIWLPVRGAAVRARRILSAPMHGNDPLFEALASLES
jgi:hypothetical protein